MQPDDVMPNDGSYFAPRIPEDRDIEDKKEKAETLSTLKVLKDILERFETRIAFYNSVDSIHDEVKTDPQQFLINFNANTLCRDNLRLEKEYIEQLIQTHTKGR